MALTVHQSPQLYTPSDNPVTWTFSSTNTAEDNFFYQIIVYVNDAPVSVEQVLPESGIYAKFDASAWASNACNIPTISNDLIVDAENYAKIKINITEIYGDPLSEDDTTTVSNVNTFKARLDDESFEDWDYTEYALGSGGLTKFLTQFPTTSYPKVSMSEQMRLMIINNEESFEMLISLYDADGVAIADDTYIVDTSSFLITILRIDPHVLINDTSLTETNFDDSSYFTIEMDGETEIYRIDIDRDCTYRTYKRIHFMSKIGAIESFSFGLISRVKGNIKSYGYKKGWGQWSGSQFNYENSQGRDIDYATVTEKSIECVSDWLMEDVQNWLVNNCHPSPLVYIEKDTSVINRRKITNTAFAEKIQENDMLFQEKLMLQLPTITSAVV